MPPSITSFAPCWRRSAVASGPSSLNKDQIAERGARMARRDDRGYREYLSEEQRSQPGCPAREVVLDQRGQATRIELFGSARCEHTQSMREWLEWRGVDFVEYDVDVDAVARERLKLLARGQRLVPVLIEDGSVVQVGWQGRGCVAGAGD